MPKKPTASHAFWPKEKTHCTPRAANVQDVQDSMKQILDALRRITLTPADLRKLAQIVDNQRQVVRRLKALNARRTTEIST